MKWSICFPSACSASNMTNIFTQVGLHLQFTDELCQTQDTKPEFDVYDIAVVCFIGSVLITVLFSTAYDLYVVSKMKGDPNFLLAAFSIVRNAKSVLGPTPQNSNIISCLHGIRAISMLWVMLGHRYRTMYLLPIVNYNEKYDWMNGAMRLFINGATYAVDTFLVVSGTLVVYCFLTTSAKGIRFNIFTHYIHRYVRLTPALGAIIVFHLTLFKHLGSGPVWPSYTKSEFIDGCQEYWWTSLLYVQNYVNQSSICVHQSWYLSIDMQLFMLSPLILFPLRRWPKPTLIAVLVLAASSIVASFLVAWTNKFNSIYIDNIALDDDKSRQYLKSYYMATHTRATPWLVGTIVGFFCFNSAKQRIIIKKSFIGIIWFCILPILLTCIFIAPEENEQATNALHIALARPAWSLAVGWVIFASVNKNGGLVNELLSLEPFILLSRLSYIIYLVHYTVMAVTTAGTKTSSTFGDIVANYALGGDVPVSIVISLAITLAIQIPLAGIETYIFRRKY